MPVVWEAVGRGRFQHSVDEDSMLIRGTHTLDDPFASWPPIASQLLNGAYSGNDR